MSRSASSYKCIHPIKQCDSRNKMPLSSCLRAFERKQTKKLFLNNSNKSNSYSTGGCEKVSSAQIYNETNFNALFLVLWDHQNGPMIMMTFITIKNGLIQVNLYHLLSLGNFLFIYQFSNRYFCFNFKNSLILPLKLSSISLFYCTMILINMVQRLQFF